MTTYDYKSWTVGGTTRVTDYIATALGENANDYELAHVETEFVGRIQEALPDGLVICGNQLYGYRREIEFDLTAIVESIELHEIAEKYTFLGVWHDDQETENLHQYVTECLGPWLGEYQTTGIEQDLEESINALMPRGHLLSDNKIYGPAGGKVDLESILAQLDFWAFAKPYRLGPR